MKNKFIKLIITVISFLILIFFEEYTYKLFDAIGFNVNKFNTITQILINIAIKIIECIIVYFIYKKNFKRSKRIKPRILKKIIVVIVGVAVLLGSSYLINYVLKYMSNLFNINLLPSTYYNIFNQKIDISLLSYIINAYLINPFLYCTIIILSISKLIHNKTYSVMLSGLISGILYSLSLNGTILFLIFNSIKIIIIYVILSLIYEKTNNMWLTILINILYLLSLVIILNYLGVII